MFKKIILTLSLVLVSVALFAEDNQHPRYDERGQF